jgi:protein-S-isoprenylcysteine O-methyltransferase Ste14
MRVVDGVVGVCWIVFWAYWLVSAIGVKPGRPQWRRWAGSRLGIVIVVLIIARLRPAHGGTPEGVPWLTGIGLAAFFAGLALAVWARIYIGRNWGAPMTEKADPELVTTGPYSRERHPIYSGVSAAMIGTGLAVSPWYLIVAAVIGAYFVYSAISEERYMTSRFPDAYPAYKRATHMLIPYVLLARPARRRSLPPGANPGMGDISMFCLPTVPHQSHQSYFVGVPTDR